MRYRIVAVGRVRVGYARDGCERFLSRLRSLAQVEVVEVREGRGADATQVRRQESDALRAVAAGGGRSVVLDERGRSFTTAALAEYVSALELRGTSRLDLLLGGAEGHDETLRSSADECWSLSPLTLPHELARLVLLEQLYRIETIRAGHPYHRG